MSIPKEFRVWDKTSKVYIKNVIFDVRPVMLYDSVVYASLIGEIDDYKKLLTRFKYDPEDFVIQQFTGLLDSNKKKVYEGDILRFTIERPLWLQYDDEFEEWKKNGQLPQTIIWEVKWAEYRWSLGSRQWYFEKNKWEVEGNIFENPELLKQ